MRGEKLHAMLIRIAEINEQRVPGPVPAGSVFDIPAEFHATRHVTGVNDVARIRHRIGEAMQPRPGAVGEHDVVRIALALKNNKDEVGVFSIPGLFRDMKNAAAATADPALNKEILDLGESKA